MHSALRPSSVLWLPSEQRWTLAGLRHVVRPGAETSLATRTATAAVAYAAPEALAAVKGGAESVAASVAHDAWAMGVLVFELLTEKSLFEVCGGREEVRTP